MVLENTERDFEMIVFDMDGVLVDVRSSWVWIHDHFGVDNDDSLEAYLRDEIDDLEFIRRDIALWKGCKEDLDKEDILKILYEAPVMPGFHECLSTLREDGCRTAIISGGLKPLAERIGTGLFDHIYANDILDDGNGLTGEGFLEVELNNKGDVFERLLEKERLSPDKVAAVGNSHIDSPMLERAGLGIAFNPDDEEVKRSADVVVVEKDLRVI
ncbi:MAG: HAD family phosphatase, partial [Lentisphaeria bacterium]